MSSAGNGCSSGRSPARAWSPHFQPIVDLYRGTVIGYEALVRFQGYPVPDPAQWFAAARRHGRAPQLEALALSTALDSRPDLPANTFLALNVGPDVLDHPDVLAVWEQHPDLTGVVIELTEHARIDSYELLEPALDRLRDAGALIAIDDAGAGYAGLQHLIGIRPHIIKLDRQLVSGVDRDETKHALVEMISTFASRIDACVLAEGIEQLGELDAVVGLGVPMAQGYLLAGPGRRGPTSTARAPGCSVAGSPPRASTTSARCSSAPRRRTTYRPRVPWWPTTPPTWW